MIFNFFQFDSIVQDEQEFYSEEGIIENPKGFFVSSSQDLRLYSILLPNGFIYTIRDVVYNDIGQYSFFLTISESNTYQFVFKEQTIKYHYAYDFI